ncbi:hypothetical protein RCL49_25270, partial [Salmonella enterica subsp. enterica serovar Typhimurium]
HENQLLAETSALAKDLSKEHKKGIWLELKFNAQQIGYINLETKFKGETVEVPLIERVQNISGTMASMTKNEGHKKELATGTIG